MDVPVVRRCDVPPPEPAESLLALADASAAMDSSRARINASIASRGSSSCTCTLLEREATTVCDPSGLQ
eukprot:583373-Pleurochrysis_carterae.AAC.1